MMPSGGKRRGEEREENIHDENGGNEMKRGQPKQRKGGQIGKVFRRPLSKDTRKWKGGHTCKK